MPSKRELFIVLPYKKGRAIQPRKVINEENNNRPTIVGDYNETIAEVDIGYFEGSFDTCIFTYIHLASIVRRYLYGGGAGIRRMSEDDLTYHRFKWGNCIVARADEHELYGESNHEKHVDAMREELQRELQRIMESDEESGFQEGDV